MRRSQSTLLVTILVVSGLFMMSQIPAISNVGTIHPNATNQERPPTTDSDGDDIPDVHENLFSEWVNWTANDGRAVLIKGLDRDDASDANSDLDHDGLNATEEYCWPYPANCTDTGFTRGLTGVIDPFTGDRSYLDPRIADTDGDGMPDGFEVAMCERLDSFDITTMSFQCSLFDPLNASDAESDPDEDGFDVDRNGFLSPGEMLTSPEEYSYGAPSNWTTELDGLRCNHPDPEGAVIEDWPFISLDPALTRLLNLLDACAFNGTENVVDEEIWLGTDPLEEDSDRYNWDGFKHRRIYPSSGDGISDGWEIHFGLDPLNRSNALSDLDSDGWDVNRDGFQSKDAARTNTALAVGEELSTLEEYLVHLDDGNTVKSGMRSVGLAANSGTYTEYMLTAESSTENITILHHDIREIISADGLMWVGTKLGLTVIDFEADTSKDFPLPQGHDLNDLIVLDSTVVMLTEGGIWIAQHDGGAVAPIGEWEYIPGTFNAGDTLIRDGDNTHIIALGAYGFGKVIELDSDGVLGSIWEIGAGISNVMLEGNASATQVEHVDVSGGPLTLYVGTDVGLFRVETASARDTATPTWVFYNSPEPTTVANNYAELRALGSQTTGNPAWVNTLVAQGPTGGADQVVWVGTPSGLHRIDLVAGHMDHSGLLEHPGLDGKTISDANYIQSITPTDSSLLIGSKWGLWAIAGGHAAVYGATSQEWIPGAVASSAVHDVNGVNTVFVGIDPGKYSNLQLMDPMVNDSDSDGMIDGWEVQYGLDPTDPWDALLDADGDGVNLNDDPIKERLWRNLDEFRYTARTADGFNATDPRVVDTDMDGVNDGAEYFGLFHELTPLWCHYTNSYDFEHICGDEAGQAANATYLSSLGIDEGTDPTNSDSDGDGMPDGWEIKHRRWIGSTFTGSNNWSLDPSRADDALWDADGDGLSNLCEYQWSQIRLGAIAGDILESHLVTPESAQTWAESDPNNVDSDGDGLPDGWEARNSCVWTVSRVGINPLNGSDAFENPDGDGFDINMNGVIEDNEAFVNWLEYNIRDNLFSGNMSLDGEEIPEGFSTDLFRNISDWAIPEDTFGDGDATGDPTDADSDGDGMPDGWEIWFARWHLLDSEWTLDPLNSEDRWEDSDDDGMSNWEEYNSIDPSRSETNANRSSPQWFVTSIGAGFTLQQWAGITNAESFGSFASQEIINISGYTTDPTNPDTDGDGFLDGLELLFTAWNDTAQTWTLNPLVPGDGLFDADNDALTDAQEFSLATMNPVNGITHPLDAPLMHLDGDINDPTQKAQRVYSILLDKSLRGQRHLEAFQTWQSTGIPSNFLATLMGITDPTIADTDDDGMLDGYEYWFTTWDLEDNRWSMNPLIDSDQWLDSDGDSYDCNQDGNLSLDEQFTNKREYESRVYGKYSQRFTTNAGLIGFGDDAISAYEEDGKSNGEARLALFNDFYGKNSESTSRVDMINTADPDTFNRTLLGISDPTSTDSDSDGIEDGWEYCYAVYGLPDATTVNHWASNPVNPFDVNYDPDSDGWYGRTAFDTPASQGSWTDRSFTADGGIIQNGIGDLPFTNMMEWLNGTMPDTNDSDNDSISYITNINSGSVVSHYLDWNLSDGREVFKYGTNPMDNDTDGDMLPDWYEYSKGWNESNDNYSSFLNVEVQWVDPSTGVACTADTTSCRPLSQNSGTLSRPTLGLTWAQFDPRDSSDANYDPDMDGNWDCSGATCEYTAYTNFMEFFMLADPNLDSPNAVRLSGETWQGSPITEWWQFRAFTLGLGEVSEDSTNYLQMNKRNIDDEIYVLIIDDNDGDFLVIDTGDDVTLCSGDITDDWELYYTGNTNRAPTISVGEHELGWYLLDLDDDHIAEGSDPLNWDTDGDWVVDWFEVIDDEEDGMRGDSSPIRYDSRQTA
ncbi:MAG TPA: hypothetical protein EYG33_08295 [Candidatus Poseidoniales archaeon]|nr:hypothetical protein [Candidatus Poseidoniales archaeon]